MKYRIIIKKEKLKPILLYCIMFILIPISGIEELLDGMIFLPLIRVLCCIASILVYMKSSKISLLMICVGFFCIFLNLSTIFNHGSYIGAIYGQTLFVIAVLCFYENLIRYRGIYFLSKLYNFYSTLIILNLIILILFPNGLYLDSIQQPGYLLGNRNTFIVYILPALCIGYHLLQIKKITHRQYYLLWGISVLTYIFNKSATSIIGMTILGTFLLFFNNKVSRMIYNSFIYVFCSLLLFYFIILNRSKGLYAIIIDITGKSPTFSGRTVLWDKAISALSHSKWLGYGIQSKDFLIKEFELSYAGHMHNLYLQILYQIGILGFILFGIILFLIAKNLLKTSNDRISRCYGCAFFALLIMSTTDFYGYSSILSMFLIVNIYCSYKNNLQDVNIR